MSLLIKTRKINHMLQNTAGKPVNFIQMAESLSEVIDCNIFIVDKIGKILGISINQQIENERIKKMFKDRQLSNSYSNKLSNLKVTSANLDINTEYTAFPAENKELFGNALTTIVPIYGAGNRLGTLILARLNNEFLEGDLLLAEYAATVVGMELLHEKASEIENEIRSRTAVKMAFQALSYSEFEAINHIFEELNGAEGVLVASKVADKVGLTRSVIVNALRKLESAGVVETRSLGMKGTYIKVLNNMFLSELEKVTNELSFN